MDRVTGVIDYFIPEELANWMRNNSKAKQEKILAEATECGTKVDELVQEDIRDGGYVPPEDDERITACLKHWEQLKKDKPWFVGTVKHMQTELVDKENEVMGHPDFICDESKDWTDWGISDLKCTGGIRMKNFVQVGKYASMWMKDNNLPFPSFLRVIRLPRKEEEGYEWVEIREPEMIQYCMRTFDRYLEIYRFDKTMREYFRKKLEGEILGLTNDGGEKFDGTF